MNRAQRRAMMASGKRKWRDKMRIVADTRLVALMPVAMSKFMVDVGAVIVFKMGWIPESILVSILVGGFLAVMMQLIYIEMTPMKKEENTNDR